MPQYAGNLYNQTNAREVAVNTQKAQPSSLFGTRNLKFFSFSMYWGLYTDTRSLLDRAITITGGSGDGKQVTYTFAPQSTPLFAVGDIILVFGSDSYPNPTGNPYNYDANGEFTVVAATNTSVTVNWFNYVGAITQGTIIRAGFNDPDSAYSYIVRAIQKVAEIYYLGRPSYQETDFEDGPEFGSFVFAISDELTTSDYDESGDDYPEHDVGEYSDPTDLATALYQALNEYPDYDAFSDWGQNGDGWSLSVLDDLGWGFAPGMLAGDPGFGLINFQPSPPVSDRRLKRNIELLETRNGIKIYSFQYLWSDEYFVGVMAQDLLGTEHESAVVERNGFYTVDYTQLGFNMMLLSEYNSLTV
jgi:hypothetical protein